MDGAGRRVRGKIQKTLGENLIRLNWSLIRLGESLVSLDNFSGNY